MTLDIAQNHEVSRLLACSGALELLVSCVLGLGMLALMQPWGTALARRGPKLRDLGSMHLDLLMLAFVQIAAALLVRSFELRGTGSGENAAQTSARDTRSASARYSCWFMRCATFLRLLREGLLRVQGGRIEEPRSITNGLEAPNT